MLGEKRETPVERAERLKKEEAIAERTRAKREAFDRRLKTAVDALLKTTDGQTLFIHLYHLCGFSQGEIPLDSFKRVEEGTLLYNATRRAIYVKLRGLATRELLLPVEMEAEKLAQSETEAPHKVKTEGGNQNG
ncbi:MAG: hypothetical protein KGJ13_02400 [Patescibacteria group bacterium]|nr:hypothetical protein [Patescibacteria group bacterium]